MEPANFDRILKSLASRRLNRRTAVKTGTAGLAVGAGALMGVTATRANEATPTLPEATPGAESQDRTEFLFVQSFQRGSIEAKPGSSDAYTLTLEQGLGHTLYFSDRPERIVGASPTDQFFAGMNFPETNPPNAALVVGAGPDDEHIAVIELTNPTYDSDAKTATYDVQALKVFDATSEMGFREEPTDLSAFPAAFDTPHLFIDDCANYDIGCCKNWDGYDGKCMDPNVIGFFPDQPYCYSWGNARCIPCMPYYHGMPANPDPGTNAYWNNQCNEAFSDCNGNCGSVW